MNLRSKFNLCLFLTLLLVLLSGCSDDNRRHNTKIYVPEGYVGWIRVEYGVPDADPLPTEWRLPPPMLWNREVIPASGLLRTSTRLDRTVGGEFYFYDGDNVRSAPPQSVLCEITSLHNFQFKDPNEKREFISYFIGPKSEEYRCKELEKLKTGQRFPIYSANTLEDLPAVGNLKAEGANTPPIRH